MYRFLWSWILAAGWAPLVAQGGEAGRAAQFDLHAQMQLWSVYEFGQERWHELEDRYVPQSGRLDILVRRARLGAGFSHGTRLHLVSAIEMDQLGPAPLAAHEDPWSLELRVLDFYGSYRLANTEALHLSGGLFRPQIGRENITGAFAVASMEKSHTQGYLRQFLTGNPFGRAAGLTLGGLVDLSESVQLRYDLGAFSPGEGTGKTEQDAFLWERQVLVTGRVLLQLGMPEQVNYRLSHRINYFDKRRGLSLGLAGAQAADLAGGNRTVWAADLLYNHRRWVVDADVFALIGHIGVKSRAWAGHIRLSSNHYPAEGHIIQSFLMYGSYRGPSEKVAATQALGQGMAAGASDRWSVGVLWHTPERGLSLSLQLTLHEGEAAGLDESVPVNDHFYEKGLGAIKRGHWMGLGAQISL